MRALCVTVALLGIVSYRSVPRILHIFYKETDWVPHFTSVINWSLRVGLSLLNTVTPINEPWLAIMDHSIDIGVKKILAVLRVKISALAERGSAITLQDCECIGIKVHDRTNGKNIASDLEEIFLKAGTPVAIIKDGGGDLKKGVNLWIENTNQIGIQVIDDVGHVFANALKCQFSGSVMFTKFLDMISHCSKKLRQTDLAFLIPPKIRTKGRYQGILSLVKWALAILDFMEEKKDDAKFSKLRKALNGLVFLKAIILNFANSVIITSQIQKILKTEGLSEITYRESLKLAEEIGIKSPVKTKIISWLNKHFEIHKKLGFESLGLIVSSDIIESLFGKFKQIQSRSSMKDMNRSVLLIPALCGEQSYEGFKKILLETKHKDIDKWDKENIPYTQNRLRRKFLDEFTRKNEKDVGPKTGNHYSQAG